MYDEYSTFKNEQQWVCISNSDHPNNELVAKCKKYGKPRQGGTAMRMEESFISISFRYANRIHLYPDNSVKFCADVRLALEFLEFNV